MSSYWVAIWCTIPASVRHVYVFSIHYERIKCLMAVVVGLLLASHYSTDYWTLGCSLRYMYISCFQPQTYGTMPTKEELMQSSNTCPICQESFEQPVMLKCRVSPCLPLSKWCHPLSFSTLSLPVFPTPPPSLTPPLICSIYSVRTVSYSGLTGRARVRCAGLPSPAIPSGEMAPLPRGPAFSSLFCFSFDYLNHHCPLLRVQMIMSLSDFSCCVLYTSPVCISVSMPLSVSSYLSVSSGSINLLSHSHTHIHTISSHLFCTV